LKIATIVRRSPNPRKWPPKSRKRVAFIFAAGDDARVTAGIAFADC
jgi:hypothetical protein